MLMAGLPRDESERDRYIYTNMDDIADPKKALWHWANRDSIESPRKAQRVR